jgi:hypothetical protein
VKVTIDSSEPLEDAVRVLGALYQVTLVVSPAADSRRAPGARGSVATTSRTAPSAATPTARPKRADRRRKRGRTQAAPLDNAEVRSWARTQGYSIADRGRLPRDVIQAYQEAHGR